MKRLRIYCVERVKRFLNIIYLTGIKYDLNTEKKDIYNI